MAEEGIGVDVLVAGTGASGMAAAVTAASQGLSVLVVEAPPPPPPLLRGPAYARDGDAIKRTAARAISRDVCPGVWATPSLRQNMI